MGELVRIDVLRAVPDFNKLVEDIFYITVVRTIFHFDSKCILHDLKLTTWYRSSERLYLLPVFIRQVVFNSHGYRVLQI